ncbi:MAG: class I SAM-dependent methyltransferase [Muribaculaceae bacterium]|nr:class I SAM-dependent methyltransferase [Muribaculaceae bacterium]
MLPEKMYNREFFSFVNEHFNSNPSELLLKYAGKEKNFDLNFATTQIINRRKTKNKLPTFLSESKFLFPDAISSEQATDERVARFHASLIGTGKNIIDLTAGLGIDAMCMARSGNEVTAIEIDSTKADTLRHNATCLNIPNLNVINDSCEHYINEHDLTGIDLFFIDPARRDELKQRTYAFSDCSPDVTSFYESIVDHGSTLMIKASPLLDINAVIKQFKYIQHIYAVSVKGECKELLIVIRKANNDQNNSQSDKSNGHIVLSAIDLDDDGVISSFSITYGSKIPAGAIADLNDITDGSFLYEPNASVMKLNAGRDICSQFPGMKKISENTELFVSPLLHTDFPGRIIEIKRKLSSHDLKRLKGKGYSVAVRNFPLKAEELKKKIKG